MMQRAKKGRWQSSSILHRLNRIFVQQPHVLYQISEGRNLTQIKSILWEQMHTFPFAGSKEVHICREYFPQKP